MQVSISKQHLRQIEAHGEATYPNEGAGFILGRIQQDVMVIHSLLAIENKREAEAQYNRYELTPHDYAQSEIAAARQGLDVVGVFHSHPDHPSQPSEFDRDHALPNFTYFITSVAKGKADQTQAWRLRPDRSGFDRVEIVSAIFVNNI